MADKRGLCPGIIISGDDLRYIRVGDFVYERVASEIISHVMVLHTRSRDILTPSANEYLLRGAI